MTRKLGTMLWLVALGGCFSPGQGGPGTYMSGAASNPANCAPDGVHNGAYMVNSAPGLMGPGGQPFAPLAPPRTPEVNGDSMARSTFAQGMPPGILAQIDKEEGRRDILQASAMMGPGSMGVVQAGGQNMGDPMGGGNPMMPNPMMGGNPAMANPMMANPMMAYPNAGNMNGRPYPPGAVAAVGCPPGGTPPFAIRRSSVRFAGPSGMKIAWYGPTDDGKYGFPPNAYLTAPGRYNFLQAAIYRLKLSDIPNRPGLDLYPTMEVVPVNNKTATFLAHSSIPVNITEEDLNQVTAGNFVVKVIYLPDPQNQDLATTGAEEIISSRLEPGADPIAEAVRRGSILLILRIGNILLELPNTPAMDAPAPQPHAMGMPAMQGMGANGATPPFGMTGNQRPMMPAPGMLPQGVMSPSTGAMPLVKPPANQPAEPPAIIGPALPTGKLPSSMPPVVNTNDGRPGMTPAALAAELTK